MSRVPRVAGRAPCLGLRGRQAAQLGAVDSRGDTHEQALANLREALELYLEDSPVPEVDVNPELATVDVRIPA